MSDKKLPKYSWLNFTEKQQIKQFMRKNPKTSLRICQKVFEEKFQRKIGLGSIHRVMKNEKVGINLNTGIRKKAIESTLASFENVIASGKLLVSILSKSMFRTHKYLKKYFVSIRYLNRFQKLKNPTDF